MSGNFRQPLNIGGLVRTARERSSHSSRFSLGLGAGRDTTLRVVWPAGRAREAAPSPVQQDPEQLDRERGGHGPGGDARREAAGEDDDELTVLEHGSPSGSAERESDVHSSTSSRALTDRLAGRLTRPKCPVPYHA